MSENALNEHLWRSFFEAASEGIAVSDSKGVLIRCNKAFHKIFGYDENELHNQHVSVLLPNDVKDQHHHYHNDYMKAPVQRRMGNNRNLSGIKKDGTEVPVEISLSPVEVDGEKYITVLVSDITERLTYQHQIEALNRNLQQLVEEKTKDVRESQRLYSLIAQNFPNAIISVFDRNLNYVFVQGKELLKLRLLSEDLIGTNYLDRIPHDSHDLVEERFKLVFNGEEVVFEHKQYDQIYELRCVPLRKNEKGTVTQILVVERNVTKESLYNTQMEEALAKEKELNELKSRFVAMASHEFRTPLTTINSSAGLILRYEDESGQEKRAKHVTRIRNSVEKLTGLLNDILSLSKLEEGIVEVKLKEFSLKDLLAEIIEQMEIYADGKVTIESNFQGNCNITSDKDIIRNILLNLISNAIKYSFDNGVVSITLKCNGGLVCEVTDNGCGIPLEEQERLFERFYRASNVTNIEGTGLGLNIVKRYSDLIGGEISFESNPGTKTTFTLKIPTK